MDDYTPEQRAELERLAEKAGKTIDDLMRPIVEEVLAAKAKYEPIVKRITDREFAALWQVVSAERQVRMVRLMLENPAVMQMEVERLNREAADASN